MINITDKAIDRFTEILMEDFSIKVVDLSINYYLRVSIVGGGCSGFQYIFNIEQEKNDDDIIFEIKNIKLIIDSISYSYLINSKIDYIDEMFENKFIVINPNANHTCGCGSSFSIK